MTGEEIDKQFWNLNRKKQAIEARIVVAARAVVPVLKDAQQINSAKELDALFYELDALTQEMTDFISSGPGAIILRLLGRMGDKP